VRRAFTLIELLVVVSIIALLISILLPALGSARKNAIRTQCLSQVRSIGQASHTYAAENKGAFPQREAENSSINIRYPHQTAGNGYDLNRDFFSQYMPIEINTAGNDRLGDEVLFCPGDMYDTRNPDIDSRYFYTYITYQFYRVRQGNPFWVYTEAGVKKQPNLTGNNDVEPSRYPLWGDLTVFTGGIYIAHDAASTKNPPEGMNTAYGDGSAKWTNWIECDKFYETGQRYYWSEVSD